MTTTAAATSHTPPALITHCTASIRGRQDGDISVCHARTSDARIAITFSGVLMVIYSCQAAQGLLEAFAAAGGHISTVPREIPAPPADLPAPDTRVATSIEWTRRPRYAVVAQTGRNKLGSAQLHWIDLYTGPITWQIRDQIALQSTMALLTQVHQTAIAVFLDGDQYAADPTAPNYRPGPTPTPTKRPRRAARRAAARATA
jgi:hypothetical protein